MRARATDIPLLARHFLEKHAPAGGWRFTPALLAFLERHVWPGNIRELENVIQQMLALNPPGPLHLAGLPLRLAAERDPVAGLPAFRLAKAHAVATFERAYAAEILARHDGNITRAAAAAR